jgi:hypothetical protein
MNNWVSVLLGWAVVLSDYPAPAAAPRVEFKPHAFFVEHACLGRPCKALGWYNDDGVVYLDERLQQPDTPEARGIWVHEMVHYLQHLSGKYRSGSCDERLAREREAYRIQSLYLAAAHGVVPSHPMVFGGCRRH